MWKQKQFCKRIYASWSAADWLVQTEWNFSRKTIGLYERVRKLLNENKKYKHIRATKNKCSLASGKRLGIIRSECVWNEFKWNGGLFYVFLFSVSSRSFHHRIYRRTTSELSGEEKKDRRTIRREKIKKINKRRREKGLKTSPNVEKRWNKKKQKKKTGEMRNRVKSKRNNEKFDVTFSQ